MRDIKSCNTDFTKGNNIKKKKLKLHAAVHIKYGSHECR